MANRQEFDKKTRVEIIKRAAVNGRPQCEYVLPINYPYIRCGETKGLEVHHNTKMDAMKSDADKEKVKLTADDGLLLCRDHHAEETAIQRTDLAKAIRVEARDLGADKPKRGFAKVSKEKPQLRIANGKSQIARRYGL